MKIFEFTAHSPDYYPRSQTIHSRCKRNLVHGLGVLFLMMAGTANAVVATVELQILNATDSNGNIVVVAGEDVEVGFTVIDDPSNELDKKDEIQLVKAADDTVVSSKKRGNAETGSVSLTVPNGPVVQLYVRYVLKDQATIVATAADPNDPNTPPLVGIAGASIEELTARIATLEGGDIDPTNEVQTLSTDGTSLTLSGIEGVGGGVIPLPQGPVGPEGPQGPSGSTGATGAQGPAGNDGEAGADGATGPQGDTGPAGPPGAIGATGATGPQGIQGNPGPQGVQGEQGIAGNDGAVGADGLPGAKGDTGDTGPQGIQGEQGPQGIQGIAGNDGADSMVPGPQGEQGPIGLTGPPGVQGDPGVDGQDGLPGIDGLDGIDGVDAPDRTAALCDLYQVLFDGGMIGALSVPEFCLTLYAIGDTGPAGGIVFYVSDGGLHGLEAAPSDQADPNNPGVVWGCSGTALTGADGNEIGTGAQNTADILAGCAEVGIAARLADNFTLNGYSDWFLPSKDEIYELYLNRMVVGGFASGLYWSSSETGANHVLVQSFPSGGRGSVTKPETYGVRAVRAF